MNLQPKSPTLDAIHHIRPDREASYGAPNHHFSVVAKFWNAYLQARPGDSADDVRPEDVPTLMALFKIGRIATNPCKAAKLDNFVDGANYLILAGDMTQPSYAATGPLKPSELFKRYSKTNDINTGFGGDITQVKG